MNHKNNMQFCLLSALGSFMVVDGHLNGSFLDIGGLIQYYFFHMPLFVFISGYFYKGCEDSIASYGIYKFKRLMVPYFIWNLIYGILAQFLRNYGFAFGEPVTLITLFVEPFRMGYQFVLNHVAWFVPTLFLVEIANAVLTNLIHHLSGRIFSSPQKALNYEVFIQTGLYLLISLGGIYISRRFRTEGFLLMAVRVMFLLLFYSAGSLYREKLETIDTIKSVYYFPVLLCIAISLAWSGRPLIYGLWNCRDFPGYVLPYLTAFMGIAFWLRAARILAPAFQDSTLVRFWGRNTYAIMMHHMMVFFLIKTLYACFASFSGLFQAFDFTAYQTDFYYCYFPRGIPGFRVFYLLAGIGVPLGFQWFLNRIFFYLKGHVCWQRHHHK
ncbi:acyltransferase family protein [Lachnospiraceae bacterium 62-35]